MYGSYGSYSSMSATSAPVYTTSGNLRSRDASCAFPSWPRRSSLSDQDVDSPRATSFVSDDDLYLCDHPSSDDDSHSISSSSSNSSSLGSASPPTTALALESPGRAAPSEAEILGMQRERLNMRKELMKMVMQEKERRRAARQQQNRKSSPKKSSCKSARSIMTPISEE